MSHRSFPDLNDARKEHAALLEVVIHHQGGWADRAALRKVRDSCQAAMNAVDDAECRQQMTIVAKRAAELYSEGAHIRWDRGSTSGADVLRLEIMKALHAFNARLAAIEAARQSAHERPDKSSGHRTC